MQLLQSPLVPTSVEEEYINKDLLRIVQQRNPAYFSRLVDMLFLQETDTFKDFAYDFNCGDSMDPTENMIKAQVMRVCNNVFATHAAANITTPLVIPKSPGLSAIYASKSPASFMDAAGDMVEVCWFDLAAVRFDVAVCAYYCTSVGRIGSLAHPSILY